MKFTSKNNIYHSNRPEKGMFENPFIETENYTTNPKLKRLEVEFKLLYLDTNANEQTIEKSKLIFTESHLDTLIDDGAGNEIEIIEFITNGGTYDKTKIVQWGRPSYDRVKLYFNFETSYDSGLEFKEQPLKQLAIDWVKQAVLIENLPIGENFEYKEPVIEE